MITAVPQIKIIYHSKSFLMSVCAHDFFNTNNSITTIFTFNF